MMRTITHSTESSVRQIVPFVSFLMATLLLGSFMTVVWFLMTRGLSALNTPAGEAVRTTMGLSFAVFVLVGLYWQKSWTFILSARANRLARRHDYFELTKDEIAMLYAEPEWSGEIIDFMGLGRTFAHFDNEHDRVMFRLGR